MLRGNGLFRLRSTQFSMATKTYLDFDLRIEKTATSYQSQVLDSPAGQAVHEFALPFSDLELENFILRLAQPRQGFRRIDSPGMETAKAFGGRLFNSVFGGDVRVCLHSSLQEATQRKLGLRIRLRLSDTPELVNLPWEFIYNAPLNRFLSLSVDSPVVRYLDLPGRVEPLTVTTALRVLVMIASPRDYPTLDVEQEWQRLKQATAGVEQRGLLVLERLPTATLAALQKQLRSVDYHVFHFIGHGGFDPQSEDGVLVLEDEDGKGRVVSGQYLGMLLHDELSLRLALLNCCEGGRTSRTDPFVGVCQSLLQQGIPAVIAMQFAITDQASIVLAHEFYGALVDGLPIESALTEARKAIFANNNEIEWATPVLYLRAADGQIFDIPHQPDTISRQPGPLSASTTDTRTQSAVSPPEPSSTPPTLTRTSRVNWHILVLLSSVAGLLIALGGQWFGVWSFAVGRQSNTNSPTTVSTAITPPNRSTAIMTPTLLAPLAAATLSTAPPGQTLRFTTIYSYTFEDGNTNPWFEDDTKAWQVVDDGNGNHVYQGSAPPDQLITSDPPEADDLHNWTDYAVTFRMRILRAGAEDDDLPDGWLTMRDDISQPEQCPLYNLEFYTRPGSVALATNERCTNKPLIEKPYTITLQTWYTIRAEIIGTHLKLLINGAPVIDWEDATSTRGNYYVNLGHNAIIQFDDVRVERYILD